MAVSKLADALVTALQAAGIPIVGVVLGAYDDRSSWKIQYDPRATAQQQIDGAALLASFDPTAPAVLAAEQSKAAQGALSSLTAKAFLAAVLEVKLGRPLTKDDVPALRALFAQGASYYDFIIQHGL